MRPRKLFKISLALQAPLLFYLILLGVTMFVKDWSLAMLGYILLLYIPVMLSSALSGLVFYYTVWKCATSIDDLFDILNKLEG